MSTSSQRIIISITAKLKNGKQYTNFSLTVVTVVFVLSSSTFSRKLAISAVMPTSVANINLLLWTVAVPLQVACASLQAKLFT